MVRMKKADLNRNLRQLLRAETGKPFFLLNEAPPPIVAEENAFFTKEFERLNKMMLFEKAALESFAIDHMKDSETGNSAVTLKVAGVDEAGRGPLAGPVVAAAIVLPLHSAIPGVNDSKQLSPDEREELFEELAAIADYGIGVVGPEQIDVVNILQATYQAMQQAVASLKCHPQYILVDAVTIPGLSIPQKGFISGDCLSVSIAAASIVAKVARDRIMVAYDRIYPQYGFASNKGYGTQEHLEALARYGPSPIHRTSFCHKITNDAQKNA